MQWTDRIRQVKILLIVMAVILSVASLVVSHFLVRDLKREEHVKMEVWADAMRSLGDADEYTDLALVLRVLNSNNTIPVVVVDNQGDIQEYRNLNLPVSVGSDSIAAIQDYVRNMKDPGREIQISLSNQEYLTIYYGNSLLLTRLAWWPYVQLGVVMIFVAVAIFALLSSKRAEQNKVWVGLSKETAHQLGTPISSLMAWVEVLRETYPDDALIPEMGNDVKRLQLIAERFSKIGSLPELKRVSLSQVLGHVSTYISRRASNKVAINVDMPEQDLELMMSAPLFEWVVENLCKNAIDAMEQGSGRIDIVARQEAFCISIEVTDTGKGIASGHRNDVFKPGFTTKSRGWGLGLSLAKRIVEEYHRGRIFVKWSEVGKGTTFRIEMPLSQAK